MACTEKCPRLRCLSCVDWVIWEVEWGGQIVATCPYSMIERLERVSRGLGMSTAERMLRYALDLTRNPPDSGRIKCNLFRPDQLVTEVPDTRLPGWVAKAYVSGGMGGGVLLEGDLWLHGHVLNLGPKVVNRFRGFLGLAPLKNVEVIWENEQDRWHADFCKGTYAPTGREENA